MSNQDPKSSAVTVDLKALAERAAVQKARQPVFDEYPPIVDVDFAVADALQIVEEWEYSDPHGWCHDRPIYLTLVSAVLDLIAERDALALANEELREDRAEALREVAEVQLRASALWNERRELREEVVRLKGRIEKATAPAAHDDSRRVQGLRGVLADMGEEFFDAFGCYPTRAQEQKFLRENPGAAAVWDAAQGPAVEETP